jgi:hypothetical protein
MKAIVLALIASVFLSGCFPMSDSAATHALDNQGFTEINLEGMAFFGCSEDDYFRKKFTAKNVNGRSVSGVVCGGFLKGATVRTY